MSDLLVSKVELYAQKLNNSSGDGEVISKRAKKRILQKLGKLKKQIGEESVEVEDEIEKDNDKRKMSDSICTDERNSKQVKIDHVTLSKKELKVKIRLLNQDLSEFAQKKQLKLAKKKVQWAIEKGYKLNVHAYTNLINVYVRCNDLEGAERVLNVDMKLSNIRPNLITYTTLLKGYCESGQLTKSQDLFFNAMFSSIKNHEMRPNVRALNTFLRGCARTGGVHTAIKAFRFFTAHSQSTNSSAVDTHDETNDSDEDEGEDSNKATVAEYVPDASTFEYLIGILSRAADIPSAVAIVTDFIATTRDTAGNKAAGGADVIENAAIYLSLAKAYALCGAFYHAKKWLLLANSAIKLTQNATLKENMMKRFQSSISGSRGENNLSNKKEETSSGTSKSVSLFLNHRRGEIQQELQLLEDYILCVESSNAITTPIDSDEFHLKAGVLYQRHLAQVLSFGFDGLCDIDNTDKDSTSSINNSNTDSVQKRLCLALRDKFGLGRISPSSAETYETGDKRSASVASKKTNASLSDVFDSECKLTENKIMRCVNEKSGHIVFEELFSQFVTADDWCEETNTAQLSIPLKVELCSGNGEWVAAQAAADRNAFDSNNTSTTQDHVKALWIALELRCDRVHNTLCQHIFSSNDLAKPVFSLSNCADISTVRNRSNLAVIGGDASKILPSRFPVGRVSAIFVNHPQPPEQRAAGGGGDKNKKKSGGTAGQGSHLLTCDFFEQMHRVLTSTGTITIVTDNLPYAQLLAEILVQMAQRDKTSSSREPPLTFVSKVLDKDSTRSLQESYPIDSDSRNGKTKKSTSTTAEISAAAVHHRSRVIEIWRGDPGVDAGHSAPDASSYFDRMWDLGQKKRRYFLYLEKL